MNLKSCVQNNDLGDLAVNVIVRSGTVSLNYTKCWNVLIMLQSPPEREKMLFFTEQQSCLLCPAVFPGSHSKFLYHVEADGARPESHQSCLWYMNLSVGWKYCPLTHIRQALASSKDVQAASSCLSWVCKTTPPPQVMTLWFKGLLLLPCSFRISLNTVLVFRDSLELPLSAFLDKWCHFFCCFMFCMWANIPSLFLISLISEFRPFVCRFRWKT